MHSPAKDAAAPGARPPGPPPRPTNHLAAEKSLYLRQHAGNPIDWYPWGDEALAKAAAEEKPIFLSVGYSSCHWCHVMEKEVFEHEDVAAFLNEHFVSIKVDREERPDVDAAYMAAVQLLSGAGGWPMSVFLTPGLMPFFGGTYYPHDAFLGLASSVLEMFRSRRPQVEQQAAAVASMSAAEPPPCVPRPVEPSLVAAAAEQAAELYDARWGGFRSRTKFPTPLRWAFLLHAHRKTGDERFAAMVRRTLDAMQSGGIRDHIGGGFHRYSVEPSWTIPHFEKMLYDNAQLASLYLEAGAVFDSRVFTEVARDTLDFMLREMRSEQGGFCASFDADSGGQEGAYYVWSPDEIDAVVGRGDGPALAALLGVTGAGALDGKSVLSRRARIEDLSAELGRSGPWLAGLFDSHRLALRRERARRVAPARDPKVVTAWNGLALSALARAYLVLGDERYREAATAAAELLWHGHRREDGALCRASNDATATGEGVLDDHAFVACALLDLFEATGDVTQIERARQLVDLVLARFGAPDGSFYLTADDAVSPLGRRIELFDAVEPSGNAAMAHALLRLGALTGEAAYGERATTMLRAQAERMRDVGLEMSWWLDAAMLCLGPLYTVVVAGEPDDERTRALLGAYRSLAPAHAVLARIGAQGPSERQARAVAITEGKGVIRGAPAAYVCRRGACLEPTTDPVELRRQLMQGWAK